MKNSSRKKNQMNTTVRVTASKLKRLLTVMVFTFALCSLSASVMDRVSISDSGTLGNNNSIQSSISEDGQYVAFASEASNLISNDTNGVSDVFVYDRNTETIERISVNNSGTEGDGKSWYPKISPDGRYVVFSSQASNFISKATNNKFNVYMYDRVDKKIKCISCASDGTPGDLDSTSPDVSENGTHVVFTSLASNIVAGDTNGFNDVYLYTVATDTLIRVKTNSGAEPNETSYNSVISKDGKFLAFDSFASNYVNDDDTNNKYDVFVYEIAKATSKMVSISEEGILGDDNSWRPAISGDGSAVAFATDATNLVAGDTNGKTDVLVFDDSDDSLTLVSKSDSAVIGNNDSGSDAPGISSDGRYVTFESLASNLVSSSGQGSDNVFLYDRDSETIKIINYSHDGSSMAATTSRRPSISADGQYVAFDSNCSTIASTKFNGNYDVYVNAWNNALLTLKVTPDKSGTTDPEIGTHSVAMNKAINISAVAESGYVFSSWSTSANGSLADSTSEHTTVTITGDTTVTATFVEAVSLTLAVDPVGTGSTTPDAGTYDVAKDVAKEIIAVAEAGYYFTGWTATENATVADSSAQTTTVTLTGDATVTATFTSASLAATLTMVVDPKSGGTTTPALGNHTVSVNKALAITATADSGYYFTGWSVSEYATIADASSASTTVTLIDNATVTANFSQTAPTKLALTMAVSPASSGTTTPAVGSSSVLSGVEQSITATAAAGYNFVGWTADTSSAIFANASSSSTTVSITEDTTVTAMFSKISAQTCTLTMSASPAAGGTTSPTAGSSNVYAGVAQKISATATTGHTFIGWTSSSAAKIADSSSATTTVTLSGDATVRALFSVAIDDSAGTVTVAKLDINSKGDDMEKDTVSLTLGLPDGFSFTPASDSLQILIGQWDLEVEKGSTWTDKGKLSYSETLDIGKVKIMIDTAKKQLIMKTTHTIVGDKVNTGSDIDIFLVISGKYYKGSCTPNEKANWKATAASTLVEGFTANTTKLTGKYTNVADDTKKQYTFTLSGDTFTDPTGGYSTDIIPTITLDQAEWDFTEAEMKNKKDSYTYKLKEKDLTLQFKVDTKKGKWSFKVVSKGSDKASSVSTSGSIRVIINLTNKTTSDEWNSVSTIPVLVKRTVKFKQTN